MIKLRLSRNLKLQLFIWYRWILRTRGVWLRGFLCWTIGITVALLDSTDKFDFRFQIRRLQKPNNQIVLVYIQQSEWSEWNQNNKNIIRPLKELGSLTDSYFWNPDVWNKLVGAILSGDPQFVALTFFFPSDSFGSTPHATDYPYLFDAKVLWASRLDSDGRAILPAFTSTYGRNTGIIDVFGDEDRNIRRFSSPLIQVPHLAIRLASVISKDNNNFYHLSGGETQIINFKTRETDYPSVNASDLINHPKETLPLLRNKVVIVGTRDLESHLYASPIGSISRAGLMAELTENVLENSWIQRISFDWVAFFLAVLVLFASTILQIYPHAVALVFLVWTAIGVAVISIWSFDRWYTWIPVLAPIVTLAVTYIVFVAYQLTLQENINWRLEEEKRYYQEIEKLKNNFVSLFSHDLKTPIAKIQAICDRLLASQPSSEVQNGLQSLRQESSELHRYIQSILRVSRIESSDFKINKEPSDINDLIQNVSRQLRPLATAKKIKILLKLEPMFAIEMDPVLIQEVILNLVENAIKYSPENEKVVISSRELNSQVVVTVTDSGKGIPPEEQSRIFEKFYRGNLHSMSTKGSGLGLYLVKYFVELHGGRAFVRSASEKGTRIGFVLPLYDGEIV